MLVPRRADFILSFLDQLHSNFEGSFAESVVPDHLDLWLDPNLRFSLSPYYMRVDSFLLSRGG
jgi:hypothetical protein